MSNTEMSVLLHLTVGSMSKIENQIEKITFSNPIPNENLVKIQREIGKIFLSIFSRNFRQKFYPFLHF